MLQRLPDVFREVSSDDWQKQEVQLDSAPAVQLSWAELRTEQSIPHCGKSEEALVGMGLSAARTEGSKVAAKSSQVRRRVIVVHQ